MDALKAILSRRSIRKYTDKQVPDSIVKEILEAAMSAPSATNSPGISLLSKTGKS